MTTYMAASAVKFCQKTRDFFSKCMAASAVKFCHKTRDFFSKFYRDLNSIFFFVEFVFRFDLYASRWFWTLFFAKNYTSTYTWIDY